MFIHDIMAIRDRCGTEAERAQINEAIDVLGDTFLEMVKAFDNRATGKGNDLPDLGRARAAMELLRSKDTRNVLPQFESDSALAVFLVKFGRQIIES